MTLHYTPDELLDITPEGLALIKAFESFEPAWYWDELGRIWTIGYGTTDRTFADVNRLTLPGPISEREAERLLTRALIRRYEPTVEHWVRVPLTPGQFSALVSFEYNTGALPGSTLLRRLNERDYAGASEQFMAWVYSGRPPRVVRGLVRRRAAERALFDSLPQPEPLEAVALEMARVEVRPVRAVEVGPVDTTTLRSLSDPDPSTVAPV